jgi:hypothetical protein
VGRKSVDENIGLGGFAMNEPRELSEPSPGQPSARSDRRRSVWRWIGGLVVLGLVGLAVVHPRDSVNPLALVCTGYLFGTMLSLTTLSAAWAVVGSGKLARRMMLSAILVAAVVVAIVTNMTLHEPSEGALLFLIVFGIVLGGQWLFAQVPLWFLAIAHGLRLTSLHGETSDAPRMTRQFGIRQLMMVTAVVAVVLGIGRLLVGWLLRDEGFLNDAGGFSSLALSRRRVWSASYRSCWRCSCREAQRLPPSRRSSSWASSRGRSYRCSRSFPVLLAPPINGCSPRSIPSKLPGCWRSRPCSAGAVID